MKGRWNRKTKKKNHWNGLIPLCVHAAEDGSFGLLSQRDEFFSLSGYFKCFSSPSHSTATVDHWLPLPGVKTCLGAGAALGSSLRQGVTWADGTGGLPPLNVGACSTFREHNISCEHPSHRKRELDLCLHTCVTVLEFAGEQQSVLISCLFPSAPRAAGDRFVQSWLHMQFLNNVPWLLTIKLNMINYPIVSPKLLLYFCAFFFPVHQFI